MDDKGIVVLPIIPSSFYKSSKFKIWMCELCTFSQIQFHIQEKAINSEFSLPHGNLHNMFCVHVMYTLCSKLPFGMKHAKRQLRLLAIVIVKPNASWYVILTRLHWYKLCMFLCCIILHRSCDLCYFNSCGRHTTWYVLINEE